MRNTILLAAASAVVALVLVTAQEKTVPSTPPASPPAAAAAPAAAPASPEEQAVRQAAEAFTKAYNAHDAQALANLFTAEAEIVDEAGQATQGREAIAQVFAEAFERHPACSMTATVDSIRLVCPTVAIEEGATAVTHSAEEPVEHNRYLVVHVKQGGKWQMVSARDLPDEPGTSEEELQQLAWMIGEWVDESPDCLILSSYRWTDNHRFILSEFTVQHQGQPAMTGTQRIGWDPLARQLRSWVFDSEGGFSEGLWTREGNQWIVKLAGVTRDGKVGSSTNRTTRVSQDHVLWESRDRVIGGELQPDIEPTPIVRKPPRPE